MRIPLTKYGWPQVVIVPAFILAAMALFLPLGVFFLSWWSTISIEAVLALLLAANLAFFRDPHRVIISDENILLAPADGKITDIEIVENDFLGGQALRIGIFLSVFNVHINRSPCDVKVRNITYKKGCYKNALSRKAGIVNESNSLEMVKLNNPKEKLIVRQISGAIARRIVCKAQQEKTLNNGEKFGMIKFGSRTELYIPVSDNIKCLIKTGDKVKAGLTALIRYESEVPKTIA